jgi:hypothetical protein
VDAIKATLHSYKSLATRKQLQITLEVPEEYASTALKMLGVADPSGTMWFGVTRLNENGRVDQSEDQGSSSAKVAGSSPAAPATSRTLPRSQRAALKCKDAAFQVWIRDRYREKFGAIITFEPMSDEHFPEVTDDMLKELLGIERKRELDVNGHKAAAWDALITDFEVRDLVRT